VTSMTTDYIASLLKPKFNAAPTLYSKHGVHDVRPSSKLWVRRMAWACPQTPEGRIEAGNHASKASRRARGNQPTL
jgi:hypothetical protein